MNISLPSELKRFVGSKVKDGTYKNEQDVVKKALQILKEKDHVSSYYGINSEGTFAAAGLTDMDVSDAAFIVLMMATKDMDEDLKMIMAEVKAMTTAKRGLRELISRVNRDVAANAWTKANKPSLDFSKGMGSQRAYHQACMPYIDTESEDGVKCIPTDLYPGKIDTIAQLEAIRDNLKGKLDSMSEMSEMTSLRLQMIMDRRSKLLSTLSNVMKKISATQDSLVQNIK